MSALVILLLAALWAVILLPNALRARREHHPVASADGFARTMTTLATRQRPSSRRPVAGPRARAFREAARLFRDRARVLPGRPASRAARRRRAILTGLVGALAPATLVGAVAGGIAWAMTVVTGLALVGYVGLLVAFLPRRGDAGPRPSASASTAAASAARVAAVRAAVTRAPAGPAVASVPAGPAAAARVPADAGAVQDRSLPRITQVSGNAGLVSIRTVPRAGG